MSELLMAHQSLDHSGASEGGGGLGDEKKQVQREGDSKAAGEVKSVRTTSQNGGVRTECVASGEVKLSGHETKEGRLEESAAKNKELSGSDSVGEWSVV